METQAQVQPHSSAPERRETMQILMQMAEPQLQIPKQSSNHQLVVSKSSNPAIADPQAEVIPRQDRKSGDYEDLLFSCTLWDMLLLERSMEFSWEL
jgi:hypothetical protein